MLFFDFILIFIAIRPAQKSTVAGGRRAHSEPFLAHHSERTKLLPDQYGAPSLFLINHGMDIHER
jgi:hypothetical protein